MVLGLHRMRPRGGAPDLISITGGEALPASWLAVRGESLYESRVDVIGGFPGFAAGGGCLRDIRLAVIPGMLLIAEGGAHGFGLTVDAISGYALVDGLYRGEPDLMVRYRGDASPRSLVIRFRPNRLPVRATRRAERLVEALIATGLNVPDETGSGRPDFTLSWERADEFASETVRWSGWASAPLTLGDLSARSEIWLTTQSLMWGSAAGQGLNRVTVSHLLDVVSARLGDRSGSPMVNIGIDGGRGAREDATFVFDQEIPEGRNADECGRMLAALRSLGLPDGIAEPLRQPWRPSELETSDEGDGRASSALSTLPIMRTWPRPTDEETSPPSASAADPPIRRGLGARLQRVVPATPVMQPAPYVDAAPDGDNEVDTTAPAPVEAIGTLSEPVAEQRGPASVDAALALAIAQPKTAIDRWMPPFELRFAPALTRGVTGSDSMAATGDVDDVARAVTTPALTIDPIAFDPAASIKDVRWSPVRAFETEAVAALASTLRAIDRRASGERDADGAPLPSASDQAAALAALRDLVLAGELTVDDGARRAERVGGLFEAVIRLQTLLDLHHSGHVPIEELGPRRSKIVDGLAGVLGGRSEAAKRE